MPAPEFKRDQIAVLKRSTSALMSHARVPAGTVVRILDCEKPRRSSSTDLYYYGVVVHEGPNAGAICTAYGFALEPMDS